MEFKIKDDIKCLHRFPSIPPPPHIAATVPLHPPHPLPSTIASPYDVRYAVTSFSFPLDVEGRYNGSLTFLSNHLSFTRARWRWIPFLTPTSLESHYHRRRASPPRAKKPDSSEKAVTMRKDTVVAIGAAPKRCLFLDRHLHGATSPLVVSDCVIMGGRRSCGGASWGWGPWWQGPWRFWSGTKVVWHGIWIAINYLKIVWTMFAKLCQLGDSK